MLSSTHMAKKKNTVVCRFKNCIHESREIAKEEAVKVGNLYYHEDCAKIKDDIALTIELFEKHINPNPVFVQLRAVINNIIFDRKVDSEFLVFALKYYIEKKIPLRYPQGLYYMVQNLEAKEAFDKKMAEKFKNIKVDLSETKEEVTFEYKPIKQKGFGDILGGV